MTYVVKDEYIKCKLLDCVEVCLVDCFYEGKNMINIIKKIQNKYGNKKNKKKENYKI